MSTIVADLGTSSEDSTALHVNVCNYCGQMEMFPDSVRWVTTGDRHFCSPEHEQAYRVDLTRGS